MNVERAQQEAVLHLTVSAAESPRLAKVPLRVLSQHACPFFPDRHATLRGVYALKKFGRNYADLLEEGFWRRTDMDEKPMCRDCKACRSLRVPVETFAMTRSQRRCWRRNRDLTIEVADYAVDPETLGLFTAYLVERHGWQSKAPDERRLTNLVEWYAKRLGRSPVKCRAFKYRLAGQLVGLSVCDELKGALYSAFFAYDVAQMKRGLGTFSILYELDWCRQNGKGHYYMANLIDDFGPGH